MVKVWVSVVSASVAEKEPVTVVPSSVALMETAPATGRTGGVGCAGVIGGGVREGDVACFAVGEVLEIGARIG